MKASTLFVICIVLLVGLGAVAAAKYVGLFEKKAPPPATTKEDSILVLVPLADLQEGVAVSANDVRVRELHPSEREFYKDNGNDIMPANVQAAQNRVPKQRIRADSPLIRSYFDENPPRPMTERIRKDMRGVNVSVPKDRCAGGLLQVGEYVDVLLTSKITDPADPNKQATRTARIDRDCKVVAKRNNLRVVLQADPEGAPISFTLQANPYRAALIQFAQQRGEISLQPVRNDNAHPLVTTPDEDSSKGFSDMGSREYRDEDSRVQSVLRGEYVVGDADLERIFAIVPPPSPIPPIRVQEIRGIYPQYVQRFDRTSGAPLPATSVLDNSGQAPKLGGSAGFQAPSAPTPDCPTCGKKGTPAGEFAPPSPPAPNGSPLPR